MTEPFVIYMNVHFPNMKEAKELGRRLMEQKLCGTIKLTPNVHLLYDMGEGVDGDDTVLMTIKTTKQHQKEIEGYILEYHSWGTPCIEILPILVDHC